MKVLLIGSGGREHALAWKIAQSPLLEKLYCAPGNPGIARLASCVDIGVNDFEKLSHFAQENAVDLTVVGPEDPLAGGIVDYFAEAGLKAFGPSGAAAQLEASKVFAKQLMAKYKVPTAEFKIFDNAEEAKKYIEKIGAPCVVKADGLAQGKGVIVAKTTDEARQAVISIMQEKVFGDAGRKVIVEDCLAGQEASIIVLTDSREVIPLASSQDHKRVFDNDSGPNTGGMGAYSPAPVVTEGLFRKILDNIIYRSIHGLVKEGIGYNGVLYAGIMITNEGPKVLEFNVRFGDPETQAILPRLKSDLLEFMLAASEEKLNRVKKTGGLNWDARTCVCVVCSSGGYPGEYEKGKEILGLEEVEKMQDVVVFHAGTQRLNDSTTQRPKTVTNGGRVLGVTGLGNTIKEAIEHTYQAVERIHFEGMHYRRDIGRKAL